MYKKSSLRMYISKRSDEDYIRRSIRGAVQRSARKSVWLMFFVRDDGKFPEGIETLSPTFGGGRMIEIDTRGEIETGYLCGWAPFLVEGVVEVLAVKIRISDIIGGLSVSYEPALRFAEYKVPAMTTREIKELAREINALLPPEINELQSPHSENKQQGVGVKHE